MITNEIGLGLKYSRNGRTIVGYDKNLYGKLLIPDGVYNSEVDDYLYGYNIDTEPFDFQDKVIYEKETANAWLERLKRFNINVRSGDESLYSELLSYYKNNIRPYQPLTIEGKLTIKSLNERNPQFREIKTSYFDFSDDDASLNPDLW